MRVLVVGIIAAMAAFAVAGAESLTKNDQGIFVSDKQEAQMPMNRGQALVINAASTLGGEIVLKAGADRCRYSYKKLLKTPAKTEAEEYAQAITVEMEAVKEKLILSLRAPARAPWEGSDNSGRLQVQIFLPDSCSVQINTAYFDVEAMGPFAEVIIPGTLCKTRVEKVRGSAEINVSNRPLTIRDARGQLAITNKFGPIHLENIETDARGGTVYNENGEIRIDTYRGGIDARTSYARLTAQHLFLTGLDNRVKNTSSLIDLSFDSLTSGSFRINNQYGTINIEIGGRVDARFICKIGEGSTVTAERLDVEPAVVEDNRLEFLSGQGTGEVRVTARGEGDIVIAGPGTSDIEGGGK